MPAEPLDIEGEEVPEPLDIEGGADGGISPDDDDVRAALTPDEVPGGLQTEGGAEGAEGPSSSGGLDTEGGGSSGQIPAEGSGEVGGVGGFGVGIFNTSSKDQQIELHCKYVDDNSGSAYDSMKTAHPWVLEALEEVRCGGLFCRITFRLSFLHGGERLVGKFPA